MVVSGMELSVFPETLILFGLAFREIRTTKFLKQQILTLAKVLFNTGKAQINI